MDRQERLNSHTQREIITKHIVLCQACYELYSQAYGSWHDEKRGVKGRHNSSEEPENWGTGYQGHV